MHANTCILYAAAAAAKLLQLYPTLCNSMDGSPPGSTVPGILQARTLKWVYNIYLYININIYTNSCIFYMHVCMYVSMCLHTYKYTCIL